MSESDKVGRKRFNPIPVWVDLNRSGISNGDTLVVYLPENGRSLRTLQSQGLRVETGLSLRMYTDDANAEGERDDLVFQGTLAYDEVRAEWMVLVPLRDIRNLSEVTTQLEHWANRFDWATIHRDGAPSSHS